MSDLILTVGSNPLPVVVAALHFQAKHESPTIHLIYSAEVAKLKDRICQFLDRRHVPLGNNIEVDAYQANQIRDSLDKHWEQSWHVPWLGYSGGTKQMTTQVYHYWKARAEKFDHDTARSRGFYLSDHGIIHFDDGTPEQVDIKLSLEELVSLHFEGASLRVGSDDKDKYPKRILVANRIYEFVKDNNFQEWTKLFPPIYFEGFIPYYKDNSKPHCLDLAARCPRSSDTAGLKIRSWNMADEKNFKDGSLFVSHDWSSIAEITGAKGKSLDDVGIEIAETEAGKIFTQKKRLKTATWLWGNWLELWLAGYLSNLKAPQGESLFDSVAQNVETDAGDPKFEADVVAIRGHQVYLFSCTTDDSDSLVKSKLFEAKQRVARLGGEYARVALISLTTNPLKVLKQAIDDGWAGYNDVRVFGCNHVYGNAAPVPPKEEPKTMAEALRDWVTQ